MKLYVEETIGNVVEVESLTTILEIADFDAGLRQMLEAEQSAITTASSNLTLDNDDKTIQFIDPAGSNRTVTLPSASIDNHGFIIKNTADAWEILTIYSGATLLCTVHKGEMAWLLSNGSSWYLGGIENRVREVECIAIAPTGSCSTGDGKGYFLVPKSMHNMNLVYARAMHISAGSGGSPTLIQVRNVTDSVDMLTTRIMIDVGETDSNNATTAYAIDTAHDDVAEGDLVAFDFDQLPTTAPVGAIIILGFQEN